MLKQFRLKTFSALVTACAALAMWGLLALPRSSGAELVDRIVAIVNDDIILLSELKQAMTVYRQMTRESGYAQGTQLLSDDQRSQLLEKMIDDKLIDQEARRLGIVIGDEEVDSTIENIQKINRVSKEEMLRVFQLKGMTFEEYRSQIKEQLLQSRIVNREVKSKVVITDADVNKYYQAHQDQFGGQTKYHLRHILMQTSSQPDEREKVYRQMQQLRDRLSDGEAFARLAEVFSQSGTAKDGGDLGFFESRLLADNIRKALQGVQAGEFTDIVDTEQGYQLFYVEEIVETGGKTFEEAKEAIYQKLLAEEMERRFEDWFKELRQRAHIEIVE